jgi:hypothetical protein
MKTLLVTATLAASVLFAAGAAQAQDSRCVTLAAQVTQAAAQADAKDAKRATRLANDGQLICAAGNERAGMQKINQAFKLLDLQPNLAATAPASGQ